MKKTYVLFACLFLALVFITPASLVAQSSDNINLAGTVWDIKITFGPDTAKSTTIKASFSFDSDGTFNTVGSQKNQWPDTWKWEGSNLVMILKDGNVGGNFTGKATSKTLIEGTLKTDYGIFLGLKNASGSDKITFTMQPQTK